MASSTAVTAVAYGASYLLPSRNTLAICSRRLFSFSPSKRLDLSYLRRRVNAPSPRRVVVRAARTESGGVKLGVRAPNFELPEPLTGNLWKLEDFELYPSLLVMFICNHCPFVIHLKKDIVKLCNFYMKKGLAVVAISSNSVVTHPQDGPEFMAEDAKVFQYPFPYLYDESQEVAREFGAVCTPEFFLYKKVMFICNHCPFVIHLKKDIVKLCNFYMKKGLAVVAISSNSVVTHPQDGPEFMAEDAKVFQYPFPYLYDESQEVAREFGAVCTPEFFLYKKDGCGHLSWSIMANLMIPGLAITYQ